MAYREDAADRGREAMVSVRLEDKAGAYVCTADLFPYSHEPDVIIWGTRLFSRLAGRVTSNGSMIYREAFTVAVTRTTFYDDKEA